MEPRTRQAGEAACALNPKVPASSSPAWGDNVHTDLPTSFLPVAVLARRVLPPLFYLVSTFLFKTRSRGGCETDPGGGAWAPRPLLVCPWDYGLGPTRDLSPSLLSRFPAHLSLSRSIWGSSSVAPHERSLLSARGSPLVPSGSGGDTFMTGPSWKERRRVRASGTGHSVTELKVSEGPWESCCTPREEEEILFSKWKILIWEKEKVLEAGNGFTVV